jgi:hypothetical protein
MRVPFTQIPHFIAIGMVPGDSDLHLSLLATPLYDLTPLAMSEATDQRTAQLLRERTRAPWEISSKSSTHVELVTPDRRGEVYVQAPGVCAFHVRWLAGHIQVAEVMRALGYALCFDLALFREVFKYPDEISVRVDTVNLDRASFEWTSYDIALESLGPSAQGSTRQFRFAEATDIEDRAAQTIMTMSRDAQLVGYEPQVLGVLDWLKGMERFPNCG